MTDQKKQLPLHVWCFVLLGVPTRTIIINAEAETREEILPDPETVKLHTQLVMMFGAMAGVMAIMGFALLMMSLVQAWGSWERSMLVEFVKATGSQCTDNVCDGSSSNCLR